MGVDKGEIGRKRDKRLIIQIHFDTVVDIKFNVGIPWQVFT